MDTSYVIISPCRDEAEYMTRTLDSVVNQSLRPAKWVIVDDGSSDSTPDILQEYASRYDFIQVITRINRGFRKVGPGVVDAFYEGFRHIEADQYRYVCKLDLDLELPGKYFETLIRKMESNARLATCSGKPYNRIKGQLISEKRGDEMSVGMTKFYRMSAFIQIGGFVREVMWDAIDCHRCRQLGWVAESWDEPDLRFVHLRMMGSSQDNILVGRMRHGFGQYYMGTGIMYMAATSLYRMLHRPYVIGGGAMFWGYLKCLSSRPHRLDDKALIAFIRKFQWLSLLIGKKRAVRHQDRSSSRQWKIDRPPLSMPLMPAVLSGDVPCPLPASQLQVDA